MHRLPRTYWQANTAPSYSVAAVAAAALAVVAAIRQGLQVYCALERRAQVCCDRRLKWAYVCARRVRGRRPEDGAARGVRAAQHAHARPSETYVGYPGGVAAI